MGKLITIVLACVFIGLCSTVTIREKYIKCRDQTSISDEVARNYLKDHQFDNTDDTLKCFSKCILEELGTLNENGDFVPEGFSQQSAALNNPVSAEQLQEFTDCANAADRSGSPCDHAFRIIECLYSNIITQYKNRYQA